MQLNSTGMQINLLCFIVNNGMSSKIIHEAKKCGIQGSTVFYGMGTINNPLLDFIGLADIRKEIIYMLADCELAGKALTTLSQHFKLEKPNHGIAFSTAIAKLDGSSSIRCNNNNEERGSDKVRYHIVNTIVEKGNAEDVISAAKAAGATGGTIINGRGSGVHETAKLFMMDIEPEKEIVMIISEAGNTEAIVESIKDKLHLNEPGNGIIFVQDIVSAHGLFNKKE